MKTILEQIGKIKEPTTILIHGKPGTGKTMFSLALADELTKDNNCFVVDTKEESLLSILRKSKKTNLCVDIGEGAGNQVIVAFKTHQITREVLEKLKIEQKPICYILDGVKKFIGPSTDNFNVLIINTQSLKSGKMSASKTFDDVRNASEIEIEMTYKNSTFTPKVLKNHFGPIGEIEWSIND